MTMTLERFCYAPVGTFGRLTGDGFTCFTVEEVWNDNKRSVSCIPEGRYLCKRVTTPRHGETFEVTGVPNRSAILFHTANTISDVEGCIGPGESLGYVNDLWAVVRSATAYQRLMRHLNGLNEFDLIVTQYKP